MKIKEAAAEAEVPLTNNYQVKVIGDQTQHPDSQTTNIETKEYARRWVVLGIFIAYAAANNSQWIQYSIISNIIERYYNVSSTAVAWTSQIFMLTYVIQVFPCSYLMDRIGLRWTAIIGSLCTCIGTWLKVYSVSPDRFYLTFIGQTIAGGGQVFVLTLPSRLAATWFGSRQVSTATSFGLFGCQLGIAGSFLITPIIVRNHEKLEHIGDDLSVLFWSFAILTTVATVAVILFFKEEPPLPPSTTRALQKINDSETNEELLAPIKRLLTNRSYLALCNSFGILIGVLNVIGTILNKLYLVHFENGETEAGQIGLAIIITGLFGSVLFGVILDKTHKFKETITAVYFLTLLAQIAFAVALLMEIKWMVYVSAVILGFFISGYTSLGYEVCAEFTYPESEVTATGVLNITNGVYGVIMVTILTEVIEKFGDLWAHLGIIAMVIIGIVITVFTKDLQRRQDARRNASQYDGVPLKTLSKN